MTRLLFACLSLLFIPGEILSFDFAGIQEKLETEAIVSQIPMEEFLEKKGHIAHFSTPVYLVELESGIKAVLKISNPEWPRDALSEVAAYKASCFLHINLVPPTIFYSKEGTVGSLQYYVEPSFDLMKDDNYEKALAMTSPDDLANIALFYFVFGQWDPDPSNLIAVEEKGKVQLALIDNAAMGFRQKARSGEHPFVLCFPERDFPEDNIVDFPFDKVRIFPPNPELLHREYGQFLDDDEVQILCRLRTSIYLITWQGKLWRQYRFGKPSFTCLYPTETMDKLKELNLETIRSFFDAQEFFWSEDFFHDILERRDQVVKSFEKG